MDQRSGFRGQWAVIVGRSFEAAKMPLSTGTSDTEECTSFKTLSVRI